MDQQDFEKAMEVIRSHADKIYIFEGDRKPIVFVYAKSHNENIDDLVFEINEYCGDRLDILHISEYDHVTVNEKTNKTEDDDLELELGF